MRTHAGRPVGEYLNAATSCVGNFWMNPTVSLMSTSRLPFNLPYVKRACMCLLKLVCVSAHVRVCRS